LVQALEHSSAALTIKNKDGFTPKDLALMMKNEGERIKVLMILNREIVQSQLSPGFRKKRFGSK